MSIYDTIETAVTSVEGLVKNGSDVNDAVMKSTSGMNRETIKRVIENVNVNAFCKLLKSGEDRTKEFPVADPKTIFEKIGDDALGSVSISKSTVPDMSFYSEPEVKTASGPRFGKPVTKHQMQMYKLAHKNLDQRQSELYRDAINNCHDCISDNLIKIAEDLSHNQTKADDLFSSVKLKFGNKYDFLIDTICKHANVKCASYKTKIYDDMSQDVLMFEQVVDALEKQSLLKKKVELEKKSYWMTPSGEWVDSKTTFPLPPDLTSHEKDYDPWENDPVEPKSESKSESKSNPDKSHPFREGLEDVVQTWTNRFSKFKEKQKPVWSKVIKPGWIAIKDELVSSGKTRFEELKKDLKTSGKISDKFEQVLKHRDVITDLMHNDPIISQQSSKVVAALYKQLTKIAPIVSEQKEIVRSFLRMITAQSEPTLDAVTAKDIVKLELALKGDSDEAL